MGKIQRQQAKSLPKDSNNYSNGMKLSSALINLCMLAVLLSGLSACTDIYADLEKATSTDMADDADMYWYSQRRTRAEEIELRRKFGIGFSYDAIYGSRCDIRSVKCQVLDLNALEGAGTLRTTRLNTMHDTCAVTHSFSEYCHAINLTGSVSGDVLIYAADYSKVASLYEHALDTVTCITDHCSIHLRELSIPDDLPEQLPDNLENYLTPSFRHAIRRIANTPKENTIVVDSFVNIFGTHVVTDVSIGAYLSLDIKTRRGLLVDYKSEETITKQKLNLLFVKKESTSTKDEKEFIRHVLDSSSIDLSVKGGDIGVFDRLILNPTPENPDATEETISRWVSSLRDDEEGAGTGNLELVDMQVRPIWEFIPDREVALRVKTRITADAPTMQELYGNLNWVNTEIDVKGTRSYYSFTKERGSWWVESYTNPYVTNIIFANRIVATVCREWVPEINATELVEVTYPVYENRVDLSAGLHVAADGGVYNVAWRYDRFKVVKLTDSAPRWNGKIYLTCGCLSLHPISGQEYDLGRPLIGYEHPGGVSIKDGSCVGEGYTQTRKFLGEFYLDHADRHANLPGWHWADEPENTDATEYYAHYLNDNNLYELCGMKLPGRNGKQNLSGRMIRNAGYRYVLDPSEAWYEVDFGDDDIVDDNDY